MRTVELTGEISLKKAVVVTAKLRKFHEKDSCAPICLQINSTGGETGSAALIITCMKDLGRDLHSSYSEEHQNRFHLGYQ